MKEIKRCIRPDLLDDVLQALQTHPEFPGITVSAVHGVGHKVGRDRNQLAEVATMKLETIVPNSLVDEVTGVILDHARTGRSGDGKPVIYDVLELIQIRTGAHLNHLA